MTTLAVLQDICLLVTVWLRWSTTEEVSNLLVMEDYHGFQKATLPLSLLSDFLSRCTLPPEALQIEVVRVTSDLRHEIHIHKEATAVVAILGVLEHVEDPVRASMYLEDGWLPVAFGDSYDIPEVSTHGFTVEEGGVLYFLSVQSPPIAARGPGMNDDYYRILS